MLTCYLDDSDATSSKAETLAGYVADQSGWERFELLAEQICSDYGVDLIRGHELDRRKKSFKGWSHVKCQRFLEDVGLAMMGNIIGGISRSINKEHYKLRKFQLMNNASDQRKVLSSLSGFGFCFGNISVALKYGDSLGISERVRNEGIRFMLESGSTNNQDVIRYVQAELDHGNLHEKTSVCEVDKRSCRAIQLADIYAFYSRRRANAHERGKHLIIPRVPDVHQLHINQKIPHDTAIIEEPFIRATNERTGEVFEFMGLTKGLAT